MERTEKFRCPGCGAEFDRSDDWISVKVRLPKDDTEVLISDLIPTIHIALFSSGDFYYQNDNWTKYVTHWMPFPEPPKEDK
jgi:hypothetical protein